MQRWFVSDATAGLLTVLLLSLPAASRADECTAHGENCMETGCCQNENETCFAKDDEWATCLFECEPGVHEGDGAEFQTPWSCTTPDLWKCSKENDDCSETGCCQNPDLKCYRKNGNFSSCKAECEPGIHEDDDPDFQTPWKCTEVTEVCGEVYQQCGGKGWDGATCCKTGCTCEVTSAYYHQCSRSDVEVGDNDGSANTCSGAPAPPPQTEGEASKGHRAKKPKKSTASKGAAPPLATVHAQVAGEKAAPKKSRVSEDDFDDSDWGDDEVSSEKAAPKESKASEHDDEEEDDSVDDDDDDDNDWGDDDDDWDDMDLAEQLPHGAAAVPAGRGAGSVAWAAAAGLGAVVVLVSAAALVRGRWRSSHSYEEPMIMELE